MERLDFNQFNNILTGMVLRVRENALTSSRHGSSCWTTLSPKQTRQSLTSVWKKPANEWSVATRLASLGESQWSDQLEVMDLSVWALAHLILEPTGSLFRQGPLLIRLRESGGVPHIIEGFIQT